MSQEKISLLLIEDSTVETENFREYVKSITDVELVGCTDSAAEGFSLVEQLHPDGIILDLELAEGDGLDFLEKLQFLPQRPYIVVTTNTTDRVTLQTLRDMGAGFILVKTIRGYNCRQVIDKFRIVRKYFHSTPPEEGCVPEDFSQTWETFLRHHLSSDLEQLGITPNLNGHSYISDAVVMLLADPMGNSDISIKIYPVIAQKYHKKCANIERSIRSAIETAWVNTSPEELKKNYTAAVRPDKGKPMNKEFICYFASKYSNLRQDIENGLSE